MERSLTKKVKKSRKNRLPMATWLFKRFNGLFAVKSRDLLLQWWIIPSVVAVGRKTASDIKVTITFVRRFMAIASRSGVGFLVVYLKACHVVTMQSSSGMRISSTQGLGCAIARTRSGLPRIIPRLWRERIRDRDARVLRIVGSLFSVYRLLEVPGRLKLSTITSPGSDWSALLPEVLSAVAAFWRSRPFTQLSGLSWQWHPFLIRKSSSTSAVRGAPQTSTSIAGVVWAAYAWIKEPSFSIIERWCNLTGNDTLLEYIFMLTENPVPPGNPGHTPLGRLGFKDEPAGKIRVFAMVDAFTNWLMKPLHDALFAYLETIPQDGTFDQLEPVLRLERAGHRHFWCYDLSAATDRLPVSLQVLLLGHSIGRDKAEAWRDMLVARDYTYSYKGSRGSLRYAVGQPMGALSSWAMLALTHHFIIQWSAMRVAGWCHGVVGKWKWFESYAVLGDDVVIADRRVAREYLRIMSSLGVDISPHKSLVSSKGGLEFAKRFRLDGVDCSPVPFKEIFAARGSVSSLVQFGRKYSLRFANLLDIMGKGYRVKATLSSPIHRIPKKVRHLLNLWTAPVPGVDSLVDWVARYSLTSVKRADNWPAVVWTYLAFNQQRLADIVERKYKDWETFAEFFKNPEAAGGEYGMGDYLESEYGDPEVDFHRDFIQDDFRPKSSAAVMDSLTSKVRSMLAVPLYYSLMDNQKERLDALVQELTDLATYATHLMWDPRESFMLLEGLALLFDKLDSEASTLFVPLDLEDRASDDTVLRRNPIMLAKLWARLDASLKSPLDLSLRARLIDAHLWDPEVSVELGPLPVGPLDSNAVILVNPAGVAILPAREILNPPSASFEAF